MINKMWAIVTTSTAELSMPHGLVVWEELPTAEKGSGPGEHVGGGGLSKKQVPLVRTNATQASSLKCPNGSRQV